MKWIYSKKKKNRLSLVFKVVSVVCVRASVFICVYSPTWDIPNSAAPPSKQFSTSLLPQCTNLEMKIREENHLSTVPATVSHWENFIQTDPPDWAVFWTIGHAAGHLSSIFQE